LISQSRGLGDVYKRQANICFLMTHPRVDSQGFRLALPLRLLHDLCAAASGLAGSLALMWSAVHGSFALGPSPHRWQLVASALIMAESLTYWLL
jgi:hypothetical protein